MCKAFLNSGDESWRIQQAFEDDKILKNTVGSIRDMVKRHSLSGIRVTQRKPYIFIVKECDDDE